MIVDVYRGKGGVSREQNNVTLGGQTHLFSHQKVSIIWVYRTLPAVVDSVVLVHLALWVIVLELKHDVREAVDRVELFRSVPLNLVEIQVGANSPWRIRSSVRPWRGVGRE